MSRVVTSLISIRLVYSRLKNLFPIFFFFLIYNFLFILLHVKM